jgi:hypothetical protein
VTTVVSVYASKFAEGEATETFAYRIADDRAELLGYRIDSFDMLIK